MKKLATEDAAGAIGNSKQFYESKDTPKILNEHLSFLLLLQKNLSSTMASLVKLKGTDFEQMIIETLFTLEGIFSQLTHEVNRVRGYSVERFRLYNEEQNRRDTISRMRGTIITDNLPNKLPPSQIMERQMLKVKSLVKQIEMKLKQCIESKEPPAKCKKDLQEIYSQFKKTLGQEDLLYNDGNLGEEYLEYDTVVFRGFCKDLILSSIKLVAIREEYDPSIFRKLIIENISWSEKIELLVSLKLKNFKSFFSSPMFASVLVKIDKLEKSHEFTIGKILKTYEDKMLKEIDSSLSMVDKVVNFKKVDPCMNSDILYPKIIQSVPKEISVALINDIEIRKKKMIESEGLKFQGTIKNNF